MTTAALTTFSAKDAKEHFGELLDTALGHPVGITKHQRLTAYLISKNTFESMVENIKSLEDQLWLLKADVARKEGFANAESIDTLLRKLKAINDEEVEDNKERN